MIRYTGSTASSRWAAKRRLPQPESPMPTTASKATVAVPREAPPPRALVSGSYANAAGTRDYKLFLPETLAKDPPLFVMLHGCSQSAADFACGTRMNELADECGGIVLYPEQSKCANMLGCWNWYDTRHQLADEGEPSMIAGMTRQVMADHGVDTSCVYVAGMSAGGAMAVILGQVYPELFAAVGVHSGVPSGIAHDFMSGLSAMSRGPSPQHDTFQGPAVATIVFHGDCDNTVHPSNANAVHAQTRPRVGHSSRSCGPIEAAQKHELGGRAVTRVVQSRSDDAPDAELWIVHGGGHAWTGGSPKGSYTDESGPDASREMLRFFLQQRARSKRDGQKYA
jgi:poly(hydroxyalkanoate) depolymerase family esterase